MAEDIGTTPNMARLIVNGPDSKFPLHVLEVYFVFTQCLMLTVPPRRILVLFGCYVVEWVCFRGGGCVVCVEAAVLFKIFLIGGVSGASVFPTW